MYVPIAVIFTITFDLLCIEGISSCFISELNENLNWNEDYSYTPTLYPNTLSGDQSNKVTLTDLNVDNIVLECQIWSKTARFQSPFSHL